MLDILHKQTVIKHASRMCSKQEVSFDFVVDFDCETNTEFLSGSKSTIYEI